MLTAFRNLISSVYRGADLTYLVSGTLASQLVFFAAAPYLTRVYGPEGFAAFALLQAAIQLLSTFSIARYDLATVVARNDYLAKQVFASGLAILLFTVFLLLVAAASLWLVDPSASQLLVIFLIGLAGASLVLLFEGLASKDENFRLIGLFKFFQALFFVFFAVGFSLFSTAEIGLLLAVSSAALASAVVYSTHYRIWLGSLTQLSLRDVFNGGWEYRRFPIFSALPAMVDNLTVYLPLLAISAFYGESMLDTTHLHEGRRGL